MEGKVKNSLTRLKDRKDQAMRICEEKERDMMNQGYVDPQVIFEEVQKIARMLLEKHAGISRTDLQSLSQDGEKVREVAEELSRLGCALAEEGR